MSPRSILIPVVAVLAITWAATAGADPRRWWNDTQVSFGGAVSDLDLDADGGGLVVLTWLESSGPADATLMLTFSQGAGASFCPPVPVDTGLDPDAEIAMAAGLGRTMIPEAIIFSVQILVAEGGRLRAYGGSTDLGMIPWDWCAGLAEMVDRFSAVELRRQGADAPDVAGLGGFQAEHFHALWRQMGPVGGEVILHARYTGSVPDPGWDPPANLADGGQVSGVLGQPRVSVDWLMGSGPDAVSAVNVAFPDWAQGSILYLRSTDSGTTFSATGEPVSSDPAVVNTAIPGSLAAPLALDSGWTFGGAPDPLWHGIFWYQDIGPAVALRFDAQHQRLPTGPGPVWGPDLGVGGAGLRDEGLAVAVSDGGSLGEPASVFLFWTSPAGASSEIFARGGLLEADTPVPVDLDTNPFPAVRPTDSVLSVNNRLTACAWDEATGDCIDTRPAGGARRAVAEATERAVFVAWIDDRTGTPSVWIKRTDREVSHVDPVLQAWCPVPDTRAVNVSFDKIPTHDSWAGERIARYLVYYGRDPGGPYENTDLDGSDPGVPDTIILAEDGSLQTPAWADIPDLEPDTTYHVVVVPEDEARNVYPPDFDPLAGRPDPPRNEAAITTPIVCVSDCGPFVFGGPVEAVPGECEIRLAWQEARGDAPVLYDVVRDSVPVAVGLTDTTWTDQAVAYQVYNYQVLARDGCADPGPREGRSEGVFTRPADTTPPEVDPPVLAQTGPCTVQVDAAVRDSCSGPGSRHEIRRDGSVRDRSASLPHEDPVPGDGTYAYQVLARDQAGNETLSAPAQITVSGCTTPLLCLHRAQAWDRDTAGLFVSPRWPDDIAFAPPNDAPVQPCPFRSGDSTDAGWGHLVFYQVDSSDVRDLRLTADRSSFLTRIRFDF